VLREGRLAATYRGPYAFRSGGAVAMHWRCTGGAVAVQWRFSVSAAAASGLPASVRWPCECYNVTQSCECHNVTQPCECHNLTQPCEQQELTRRGLALQAKLCSCCGPCPPSKAPPTSLHRYSWWKTQAALLLENLMIPVAVVVMFGRLDIKWARVHTGGGTAGWCGCSMGRRPLMGLGYNWAAKAADMYAGLAVDSRC
jgi:hypothetical protein